MKKLIALTMVVVMMLSLSACGSKDDSTKKLSSGEGKKVLDEMGYDVSSTDDFLNNYLTLGTYTGFTYEITQEMWDEYIADDTQSYEIVKRKAKDTDQVTFNIIGYVDGKKVKDLTLKEQEVIVGESNDGLFKVIPDLVKGKSAGDVINNVKGIDANEVSNSGIDYTGKNVTFDVKVMSVAKLEVEKITNDWVRENYYDDYGWKTVKDYYEGARQYLQDEATSELWQQVLDGSVIKKYPVDAYARIIKEVDADNNYTADEWGMTLEEYYETFSLTEEDIDKQYENELASEMVAWAIAIKEGLTNISEEEMEANWESMYEDLGYNSVEEMKADRDEKEIIRAIILDRASEYVVDNSTVKESYKRKKQIKKGELQHR